MLLGICLYAVFTLIVHRLGVAMLDEAASLYSPNASEALFAGYFTSPLRQRTMSWSATRLRKHQAMNTKDSTGSSVGFVLGSFLGARSGGAAAVPRNVSQLFSAPSIRQGMLDTSIPQQPLFTNSVNILQDIMRGLKFIVYPQRHAACVYVECSSFRERQAAHESRAELAFLMPSAPRIIRSPAVSKDGWWGGDGTFLRAPAWLLQHRPDANVSELEAACSGLHDCDGFLPSLGLLAGISAVSRLPTLQIAVPLSIVPANRSAFVALPTAGMQGVRTLAPTTADLRLLPTRPLDESSLRHAALRRFAGLPMMHLVGAVERKANVTGMRTAAARLEAVAKQCLDRPACVAFSCSRWSLLEYPLDDATDMHRQASVLTPQQPSATSKQIARLLSVLTMMDQTRQKVFDLFLRLPDPSAAAAVLQGHLASAPRMWSDFALHLSEAALQVYSPAAEKALVLAKPDEPCEVFILGGEASTASPTACGWLARANAALHSGALPQPVQQAVRDLYAVISLRGASTAYVVSSVVSFLVESSMCTSRTQLYVGEVPSLRDTQHRHTTHRGLHTLRLLFDAAYAPKYGAIAWNPAPCLSVLGSSQYMHLQEAAKPPHTWGEPWLPPQHRSMPNGRKRVVKRRLVQQLLDFVSIGAHAVSHSPSASVAVWEDDCAVCRGTLGFLQRGLVQLQRADPHTALLKVGNGGSGILIPRALAWPLLAYLAAHRGRENVDVLMYLFALDSGWSDYLAHKTLSAHRGRRTSLKISNAFTPVWGRVECGNELDFYWGEYAHCGNSSSALLIAKDWKCPQIPREEAEPHMNASNATIHS